MRKGRKVEKNWISYLFHVLDIAFSSRMWLEFIIHLFYIFIKSNWIAGNLFIYILMLNLLFEYFFYISWFLQQYLLAPIATTAAMKSKVNIIEILDEFSLLIRKTIYSSTTSTVELIYSETLIFLIRTIWTSDCLRRDLCAECKILHRENACIWR